MSEREPGRPDPVRPLRAFAQVARLGSVSRAAEALGLSQPAVTLQLQALAREHGVALLERSGKRLVPTEAGEALLALARPLVDGIDGLAASLQAQLRARAPAGLAVAAGGVALRRLLPAAMAATGAEGGGRLQVRHAGGADALALVRDGSVAIAVGSWLDVPGDIAFAPLLRSPARLVAPAAHPLARAEGPTLQALAGHSLVLPRGRSTTRQLVDLAYARAGLPFGVAQEAGSWAATLALVALGQGITVSTALAIGGDIDDRVVVRPLPDAFPARPYGFAIRRGRTPNAAMQAFIDALRVAAAATGYASPD